MTGPRQAGEHAAGCLPEGRSGCLRFVELAVGVCVGERRSGPCRGQVEFGVPERLLDVADRPLQFPGHRSAGHAEPAEDGDGHADALAAGEFSSRSEAATAAAITRVMTVTHGQYCASTFWRISRILPIR